MDSQKQLRRAMEDAFSCSFEKKVIVEEWIEGKEYSPLRMPFLARKALLSGDHRKIHHGRTGICGDRSSGTGFAAGCR